MLAELGGDWRLAVALSMALVLGLIIGTTAGARRPREPKTPPHRHDWSVVGVNAMERYHTLNPIFGGALAPDGSLRKFTQEVFTRVLERCDCTETRTRDLQGEWTLEQLRPPLPPVVRTPPTVPT